MKKLTAEEKKNFFEEEIWNIDRQIDIYMNYFALVGKME